MVVYFVYLIGFRGADSSFLLGLLGVSCLFQLFWCGYFSNLVGFWLYFGHINEFGSLQFSGF